MLTRRSSPSVFILLLFGFAALWAGAHRSSLVAGDHADAVAIRSRIASLWAALGKHERAAFSKLCDQEWSLYTASGLRFDAARLFQVHRANMRDFSREAQA